MVSARTKHPRFTIAIIAVAAVMLIAVTTELTITGYAFAYNRSQATSQVSNCGNGSAPTNILCQNIGSQIQGDDNIASLPSSQISQGVGKPPSGEGFQLTLRECVPAPVGTDVLCDIFRPRIGTGTLQCEQNGHCNAGLQNQLTCNPVPIISPSPQVVTCSPI